MLVDRPMPRGRTPEEARAAHAHAVEHGEVAGAPGCETGPDLPPDHEAADEPGPMRMGR